MAKRSGRPPLYDLITNRQPPSDGGNGGGEEERAPSLSPSRRSESRREPSRRTAPAPRHPDPGDAGGSLVRWLTPDTPITVPTGYVYLAAAGVLILLALLYMVGFYRGEQTAKAEFDRSLLETARDPDLRPRDPLSGNGGSEDSDTGRSGSGRSATRANEGAEVFPVDPATDRNRPQRPGQGTAALSERTPPQPPQTKSGTVTPPAFAPPSQWRAIDAPLRQPGRWYFIVATTVDSGAVRLAEFIREEGLEAYVDCQYGKSKCQVIIFPGLESSGRTEPVYRALDEALGRIGRKWQSERRGGTDLKDRYVARYTDDSRN